MRARPPGIWEVKLGRMSQILRRQRGRRRIRRGWRGTGVGEESVLKRGWSAELNAVLKRTAALCSMEMTFTRAVVMDRWSRLERAEELLGGREQPTL